MKTRVVGENEDQYSPRTPASTIGSALQEYDSGVRTNQAHEEGRDDNGWCEMEGDDIAWHVHCWFCHCEYAESSEGDVLGS